jgi:hypothetical protein
MYVPDECCAGNQWREVIGGQRVHCTTRVSGVCHVHIPIVLRGVLHSRDLDLPAVSCTKLSSQSPYKTHIIQILRDTRSLLNRSPVDLLFK